MATHVVKSVGVLSIAKIMGLVYACIGLLAAPIFLFIGLLGSVVGEDKNPFAGVIGIVMAIMTPLFYGVLGFIGGAIGALLYNLFSKLVGGFELELDVQPTAPRAPYPLVPPATPAAGV